MTVGPRNPRTSPRVRCDNVPEASGAMPIVVDRMALRVRDEVTKQAPRAPYCITPKGQAR